MATVAAQILDVSSLDRHVTTCLAGNALHSRLGWQDATAHNRKRKDNMAKTLFEKIWSAHVVRDLPDGSSLLYIDRHLVHEVTSPQAFEGLRLSGRPIRRPNLTFSTMDHNVPTTADRLSIADPVSRAQVEALQTNCADFGVEL